MKIPRKLLLTALSVFLLFFGARMPTSNAANTINLETVLKNVGEIYLNRVEQTVIPSISTGVGPNALHEITTFSNLFMPKPGMIHTSFPTLREPQISQIRELVRDSIRTGQIEPMLQRSIDIINTALRVGSSEEYSEAAKLFFGAVLVWQVRSDYFVNSVEAHISDDKIFDLIEQVGRSEPDLTQQGQHIPGVVFAASYLLRHHLRHDVSDLYYFWAAIVPRLKIQFGQEMRNLPAGVTRNLFEFLVYGIEAGAGKMEGLAQNFLSDFETIFPSINQHFPFNDKVGKKNYGKLGILREQYKLLGNTSMVDNLSQLRLRSLSSYKELTPSWIERFLLKIWGLLTAWGTSASRIFLIGIAVYLILLVAGVGSITENLRKDSQKISRPYLESAIEITSGVADRFVSYATLKHDNKFENRILDNGFSIIIFAYYSILLGVMITFILRHS